MFAFEVICMSGDISKICNIYFFMILIFCENMEIRRVNVSMKRMLLEVEIKSRI